MTARLVLALFAIGLATNVSAAQAPTLAERIRRVDPAAIHALDSSFGEVPFDLCLPFASSRHSPVCQAERVSTRMLRVQSCASDGHEDDGAACEGFGFWSERVCDLERRECLAFPQVEAVLPGAVLYSERDHHPLFLFRFATYRSELLADCGYPWIAPEGRHLVCLDGAGDLLLVDLITPAPPRLLVDGSPLDRPVSFRGIDLAMRDEMIHERIDRTSHTVAYDRITAAPSCRTTPSTRCASALRDQVGFAWPVDVASLPLAFQPFEGPLALAAIPELSEASRALVADVLDDGRLDPTHCRALTRVADATGCPAELVGGGTALAVAPCQDPEDYGPRVCRGARDRERHFVSLVGGSRLRGTSVELADVSPDFATTVDEVDGLTLVTRRGEAPRFVAACSLPRFVPGLDTVVCVSRSGDLLLVPADGSRRARVLRAAESTPLGVIPLHPASGDRMAFAFLGEALRITTAIRTLDPDRCLSASCESYERIAIERTIPTRPRTTPSPTR